MNGKLAGDHSDRKLNRPIDESPSSNPGALKQGKASPLTYVGASTVVTTRVPSGNLELTL